MFREDFLWGGSVPAMQTEGIWNEGGKGLSVSDVLPVREGLSDWKDGIDFFAGWTSIAIASRSAGAASFPGAGGSFCSSRTAALRSVDGRPHPGYNRGISKLQIGETEMNRTIEALQTVLPVLIMLGIGMLCRSRKLISREGVNALKSVVVNIALPAVLLNAFATTSYTFVDVLIPLLMFLVCLAAWALGKAAARVFKLSSRFVPFLTTGFEAGMLGYALFNMLYGSGRTAEFARIDLGQVLFVFTLYKILLGLDGREKARFGQLFREMALSPIIIAIVCGVLLGATGLYRALAPSGISGIFDACTSFIAAPTSAIILLTIGYDLVLGDIPWASTGKVVALRFAIMMLLRFAFLALLRLVWPEANLTAAINVMFILPPPFVLPVFADDAEQRVYVSSALSVSTLVAIVGFAVLAAAGI